MASSNASLPDDIEALKALVLAGESALREREGDLADLRSTVTTLQQTLSDRALEIEHLKLWIAKLQRMQFGRKSEKIDRQIEQLELRLEDLQADDGVAAVDEPKRRTRPEAGKPTGRKPLPAHLPREDVVHQPDDESCPQCGGTLAELGEDIAEQLDYVPGHWRVIRHRRLKKACTCCDCIVQATAPSRPIDRGMPVSDLRARRRGAQPLDTRGLGRPVQCVAPTTRRSHSPIRDGCREDPRRRHAGTRARTRKRQDTDGTDLDIRSG